MDSDGKAIEFDSFFELPKLSYMLISLEPYGKRSEHRGFLYQILYYVLIVDMNAITLSEAFYCVFSILNQSDLANSILTSAFVTFVIISNAKMYDIYIKRSQLDALMVDLDSVFPKTLEKQAFYNVEYYYSRFTKMVKVYLYTYVVLVWGFNFQFLLTWLVVDFLLGIETIQIDLVFSLSLPWDYKHHWSYPIVYALAMVAGHVAILSNISNDLLLCGIATHLTMHYDYLAKLIKLYVPAAGDAITGQGGDPQDDLKFLGRFIAYHNKIIDLCEQMNYIFGRSLLFNFLLASLSICFVAFAVASHLNIYLMICMVVYMTMLMLQVCILSVYSQVLVTASEGLNYAIYAHDWHNANIRYKKMLIVVLQRSQQSSMIMATNFLPIDMNSFTRVLNVSYQFFAVLRTMSV